MLFMTYRPKAAKNVKAEKITEENIVEVVACFGGTAKVIDDGKNPKHVKIATLDGVVTGNLGDWVVRLEDGVEIWGDPEFNEKYERARNLRDGQ
jgi:hypothetical protein